MTGVGWGWGTIFALKSCGGFLHREFSTLLFEPAWGFLFEEGLLCGSLQNKSLLKLSLPNVLQFCHADFRLLKEEEGSLHWNLSSHFAETVVSAFWTSPFTITHSGSTAEMMIDSSLLSEMVCRSYPSLLVSPGQKFQNYQSICEFCYVCIVSWTKGVVVIWFFSMGSKMQYLYWSLYSHILTSCMSQFSSDVSSWDVL